MSAVRYFSYLLESQKTLKERREANYGSQSLLKDDIFINPILHIDNQNDDYFMLDHYVLLGNRVDDPDKYDILLELVKDLLGKLNIVQDKENKPDGDEENPEKKAKLENLKIDGWIRQVETVDLLMDYFQTRIEIEERKDRLNQDPAELSYWPLKHWKKTRKGSLTSSMINLSRKDSLTG